jgi:hypothetical protein
MGPVASETAADLFNDGTRFVSMNLEAEDLTIDYFDSNGVLSVNLNAVRFNRLYIVFSE